MSDKTIEIIHDGILIDREHLRAVQYKFGDEKVWIPKSLLISEDLVKQTVTIPEWLVIAKGLEGYAI